MGFSSDRSCTLTTIRAYRAPTDDLPKPDRLRELSVTDRHGCKRGSFPKAVKLIEHDNPRLVPDARGCFPVRLSVKAGRHGAKAATGLPIRGVREAYEPFGLRVEVREQDKANLRRWRELDAAAFDLTQME